jgi:hypothetical protein
MLRHKLARQRSLPRKAKMEVTRALKQSRMLLLHGQLGMQSSVLCRLQLWSPLRMQGLQRHLMLLLQRALYWARCSALGLEVVQQTQLEARLRCEHCIQHPLQRQAQQEQLQRLHVYGLSHCCCAPWVARARLRC